MDLWPGLDSSLVSCIQISKLLSAYVHFRARWKGGICNSNFVAVCSIGWTLNTTALKLLPSWPTMCVYIYIYISAYTHTPNNNNKNPCNARCNYSLITRLVMSQPIQVNCRHSMYNTKGTKDVYMQGSTC